MIVRPSVLFLSAGAMAVSAQVVAGAPARGAEPSWGPTVVVAEHPRGASLAVDAKNRAAVAWESHEGAIMVARRGADGTWAASERVGWSGAAMASPRIAADAHGHLTVAWITQRPGFTDGVTAAMQTHAGWSHPVRLSKDLKVARYPQDGKGAWGADTVRLAVTPKGAATVAWNWGSEARNKPWRIQARLPPARRTMGWRGPRDPAHRSPSRRPGHRRGRDHHTPVSPAGPGTPTIAEGPHPPTRTRLERTHRRHTSRIRPETGRRSRRRCDRRLHAQYQSRRGVLPATRRTLAGPPPTHASRCPGPRGLGVGHERPRVGDGRLGRPTRPYRRGTAPSARILVRPASRCEAHPARSATSPSHSTVPGTASSLGVSTVCTPPTGRMQPVGAIPRHFPPTTASTYSNPSTPRWRPTATPS